MGEGEVRDIYAFHMCDPEHEKLWLIITASAIVQAHQPDALSPSTRPAGVPAGVRAWHTAACCRCPPELSLLALPFSCLYVVTQCIIHSIGINYGLASPLSTSLRTAGSLAQRCPKPQAPGPCPVRRSCPTSHSSRPQR